MTDITVRLNLGGLPSAPAALEREMTAAMHEATIALETAWQRNVTSMGAVDTGAYLHGIVSEVQPLAGGVRGLVGTLRGPATYPRVVEEGRRAGAKQPPSAAIAAWISRRGGNPRKAFAAAKGISRRGIRARPVMHGATASQHAAVQQVFHTALGRFVAGLRRGAA